MVDIKVRDRTQSSLTCVEPEVSSHWHFHFSSNSLSKHASVAALLVFTTATFSGAAIIRTDFIAAHFLTPK
jgi:hypothetical protein